MQELSEKGRKLQKEGKEIYDKMQLAKKMVNDSVYAIKAKVASLKNGRHLDDLIKKAGINKDSISKMQRILMSVDRFNIGRSVLDYSELTVRNISITGIDVAVTPGPYIAVATGYLDYRYRDFIFRNTAMPKQFAYMGRLGLTGNKERGIFLTGYSASRDILNVAGTTAASRRFRTSGYSVQGIWSVGKQNVFTFELAKSNVPGYRPSLTNATKQDGHMLDFDMRSNEAYYLGYVGTIDYTKTRIKASYKRLGADFQSLSAYSYHSVQNGYSVTIDQPLLKKMLMLRAGIRKNEFTYPYLQSLSSNAVFKTAQLTFRKPKWPMLMAGYYPATQIVVMPDKEASEITYHTLSATSSYQYKIAGLNNSSMLLYSRFFNRSTDTSFVYFNATYLSYQHFIWLNPFTLQAGYSQTTQTLVGIKTLKATLTWNHRKGITLTGGLKYNRIAGEENGWGGNARMVLPVKQLGVFQLGYDRSYLPAWQNKKLVAVDMGKLIYTKTF